MRCSRPEVCREQVNIMDNMYSISLPPSGFLEGTGNLNPNCPESFGTSVLLQPKLNPALKLPHEILDTICDPLCHSDLKALRLTSRVWQPSAEKVLFDVIYLKFNGASFQRLQEMSDHPKFSKLVHCIQYDSRQLENAPAYIQKSLQLSNDQYLSAYTRAVNAQRLASGVSSRLEFVEALTQFQEFQSNFLAYATTQRLLSRDEKESNTLAACISKLPNLLALRHSFNEKSTFLWHLPSFTGPDHVSGSILGELSRQTDSTAHQHFWDLFGAAHSSGGVKRLQELQGSWYHLHKWTVGAVLYIDAFNELTTLHKLDLGFFEAAHVHPDPTTLRQLLKNAPSLLSLQLSYVPGYDSKNLSLLDTMPLDFHWRHLGRLVLQGFETTEGYLRRFLLRHADTIHSLELGSMLFCQPEGGKPGSWIEFIIFLNESLSLRHVNFRGVLSNGVDEAWHVNSHDIEEVDWPLMSDPCDCLKHCIERFITASEPCPFEALPEDADLTPYFNLPWMFENNSYYWKFDKRVLQEFSDFD